MNESLHPEAKIRLKYHDWEVEITCTEQKVKEVVENVLSGMDTSIIINSDLNTKIEELKERVNTLANEVNSTRDTVKASTNSAVLRTRMTQKAGMTCRALLEDLWSEGYFGTEKHLGEVHLEMSRRGFNYDRTAVSHSLTDMVRENILARNGTMRNYQYIQKRPPHDSS
ncbi:hypothetical protein [Nitrososphaera sp. AFS]|uniref:hypothetical protein n=1 Tax=Nitrososphaera sp. AFS TaxID=2301191 RepID=UPI001392314F|nr:hypothetical protein [Nitrososphaera sp. AFS]NAL77049.1 hypothetical protein [Nitrososphaera sp. AFS]